MHQPPDEGVRYVEVQRHQPAYRKVIVWFIAAVAGAAIASVLGAVYPRIAFGWPPAFTDPDAIAADKELEGYAYTLEMVLITSQTHRTDLANVSAAINNCRIWPSYAVSRVEDVMQDRQAALDGWKKIRRPPPASSSLSEPSAPIPPL